MKNIVKIENGLEVVSMEDISRFSNVQTKNIKELIKKYEKEFKELGLSLPKEYGFKTVLLNEPQAWE